jgi:hypothetical protein
MARLPKYAFVAAALFGNAQAFAQVVADSTAADTLAQLPLPLLRLKQQNMCPPTWKS